MIFILLQYNIISRKMTSMILQINQLFSNHITPHHKILFERSNKKRKRTRMPSYSCAFHCSKIDPICSSRFCLEHFHGFNTLIVNEITKILLFFSSLAFQKQNFRAKIAHSNSLGTVRLTNRHSLSFYFSAEKFRYLMKNQTKVFAISF